MISFQKPHFKLLEKTLDASTLRQRVIANNIANAETPFFKRSEVRFEELLTQEMSSGLPSIIGKRTHPRHFYIGNRSGQFEPQITTDSNSLMTNNLNNVDTEVEMTTMARNQLRYNALVQQVGHEFKLHRSAMEAKG